MTHRIYTGTFAALEPRLLACITEQQAGDPLAPVCVLVGSNLLAAYLKSRIATLGPAANIRFLTFADLAEKLLGRPGAPRAKTRMPRPRMPRPRMPRPRMPRPRMPRPRIPRLGASLLIEEILEDFSPEVFDQVRGLAGFRGALLDTFRDLRDAGITPEALARALPGIQGITSDRAEHLQGLAQLYGDFRARIAVFRDTAEDLRQAADAAADAGCLLEADDLFIYGIYDVTGTQDELLAGLKCALDLTYFIPYTSGTSTRFAAPFVEKRRHELNVLPVALDVAAPAIGSLGTLAGRLFELPIPDDAGTPVEADGSFALISVPGQSRAAVEVVREVLRAVSEGVITGFHEAAVVVRQPEEEIPMLTEAFRLRDIPHYIHGGTAFSQRPLARAVLAVAALEGESFSRRAILSAMELIAAALPEAAADWNVPQWRALVNDPRFMAGAAAWDAGCDALVRETGAHLRKAETRAESGCEDESSEDGRPESLARARQRAAAALALRNGWRELRRVAAGWPAACSWLHWSGLLRERLTPLLSRATDWNTFATVFDDLGSLANLARETEPAPVVSRAKFTSALTDAVAGLSIPEGRFQRSGVNLISVTAARGLRFPLVIVPGLDEGRFPARLRQDPLLLDAERSHVGNPSPLPLKSLRGDEEKLLFQILVRSAERRLVLMTSRLDETSDRERIPSQFFIRCAAAARGSSLTLKELIPENVPGLRSVSLDNPGPGGGRIAVDKGEIRLGMIAADPIAAREALSEVARLEPELMAGPMAYEKARWDRLLTSFDGRILDSSLWDFVERKLHGDSPQFSSSRIEEYAKCPYSFFLRRVHGLEKWDEEEAVDGMDPLLRGQVVHAILEGFVADLAGTGFGSSGQAAQRRELLARANRELDANRPAALPELLWDIEKDRLLTMLDSWLAFEIQRAGDHLTPVFMERSFGTFQGNTQSPPYRIAVSSHNLDFRGRIDRIDVSADGTCARIVDYKTGFLPATMAKKDRPLLMAGEKIQLAIYCGALSGMEDLKAVSSVEAEYLHLQPGDGDVKSCSYSGADLGSALERLPEMLQIIDDGMRAGVFFARSSGTVRTQDHCRFCDFLLICGKDRAQREAFKSGDPFVQRFLGLRKIDGAAGQEVEP